MISFNYSINFGLFDEQKCMDWISQIIVDEGFEEGDIQYVFCDDDYISEINLKFLNHDTLTDVISFDYCLNKLIFGEVFISIDRVKENAKDLKIPFVKELYRVIIHAILHFFGFKDSSLSERKIMRYKEEKALSLFFK